MNLTRTGIQSFILFIINPFLSFLFVILSYKNKWAKNIVWGISIFYGFSFVISENSTSDSVRYASKLRLMFVEKWNLNTVFANFYLEDDALDLYQPLATFLISKFTDNYNVLFSFFGIVFGYFYSRNIWIVLSKKFLKLNFNELVLILSFGFIISIASGINGVRMWTASHVFIFGCLLYFVNFDKRGLFFALISLFIHWSFVLPILVLLIYLILKKLLSIHLLMIFLFFSFIISFLGLNLTSDLIINPIPVEVIQSKSSVYLDSDYAMQISQSKPSLFLVLSTILTKIYFLILFLYIYIFKFNYLVSFRYLNFFIFILVFFSISNFISLIPDGGRFINVSQVLSLGFILLFSFEIKDIKFNRLLLYLSPILILLLIIEFRFFIDYVDFSFFYGNFFTNGFIDHKISIGERFFN